MSNGFYKNVFESDVEFALFSLFCLVDDLDYVSCRPRHNELVFSGGCPTFVDVFFSDHKFVFKTRPICLCPLERVCFYVIHLRVL